MKDEKGIREVGECYRQNEQLMCRSPGIKKLSLFRELKDSHVAGV